MKKITLFALSIIAVTFCQAKIWRVNNGTGVTADFTTAQAAHDGAAAGDTIHLEPSINNYGNLTISKKITIISTGEFSTADPGIQVDAKHAYVGQVAVSNPDANGSVISVAFGDGIYLTNVNNITLINCVGRGYASLDNANCCSRPHIQISNSDNIVISKCMVSSIRILNNSNNTVVSNNIVYGIIGNESNCDCVVTQNVVRAGHAADATGIFNSVVANNIWNKGLSTSFTNCNLSNNFVIGTGTPAAGFTFVEDGTTVFINPDGGWVDNAYQLKAGSPAIAAGQGGIDCGAFGGNGFRLGVTPAIPSIYKLNVPANPTANTMTITFSARSNN